MPYSATHKFFRGLRALPPLASVRELWSRPDLPRVRLYSPLYDPFIEVRAGMLWDRTNGWSLQLVAVQPAVPGRPARTMAWVVEAFEQIRELCFRIPAEHLEVVGYRATRRVGTVMLLRVDARIQFMLDRVDRAPLIEVDREAAESWLNSPPPASGGPNHE
jgi:hypothetical protein